MPIHISTNNPNILVINQKHVIPFLLHYSGQLGDHEGYNLCRQVSVILILALCLCSSLFRKCPIDFEGIICGLLGMRRKTK